MMIICRVSEYEPNQCTLGNLSPHVKNGRLTGLSHFAEDSDPTEIGKGIVDVIDDDTRILGPMIRKSWLDSGPGSYPGAAVWTLLLG